MSYIQPMAWWTDDLGGEKIITTQQRRDKTGQHWDKTEEGDKSRMECGTPQGGGGLPSFSSVWWSLDGFLLPDLHLPSRLKKFSSSSLPYSGPAAPPSDSFTALVNFTWNTSTHQTVVLVESLGSPESSSRPLSSGVWRTAGPPSWCPAGPPRRPSVQTERSASASSLEKSGQNTSEHHKHSKARLYESVLVRKQSSMQGQTERKQIYTPTLNNKNDCKPEADQ